MALVGAPRIHPNQLYDATLPVTEALVGGGMTSQVGEIEGAYVQLEVAYCLRSVEEAMRIAEPIEVGVSRGSRVMSPAAT